MYTPYTEGNPTVLVDNLAYKTDHLLITEHHQNLSLMIYTEIWEWADKFSFRYENQI